MPNLIFLICKYLFLLLLIALISLGFHRIYRGAGAAMAARNSGGRRQLCIFGSCPTLSSGVRPLPRPRSCSLYHFRRPIQLPARQAAFEIKSASYGLNCRARQGNATRMLSTACNGKDACNYVVDVNVLGDPAPGCVKNFVVDYQCAPDNKRLTAELPAEAGLKSRLQLSCATPTTTVKPGAVVRQPSFATATRLPSEVIKSPPRFGNGSNSSDPGKRRGGWNTRAGCNLRRELRLETWKRNERRPNELRRREQMRLMQSTSAAWVIRHQGAAKP